MEATGWRWPPDVLLRQSEVLMEDLMTIAGMSVEIKEQVENG